MSQKGYEIGTLIGTIDPQVITTAEVYTDVIDMSDFDQVTFYFLIGGGEAAPLGSANIDARVVTCNAAGDNRAAFKTADLINDSASSNINLQIIVNISAEDLAGGAANADRYVRGGIEAGSQEIEVACAVIGYLPKHGPAHADLPDLASIREIEDDKDD
ncbi:MAG: hypothetical protein R6U40_07470 [Desulfobacterales bacterium]